MKDIRDHILYPDKVLTLVRKFIDTHKITTDESVYQSDVVLELAPDLIAELAEAAGFYEGDEEGDIHDDPFYDEENPYGDDQD